MLSPALPWAFSLSTSLTGARRVAVAERLVLAERGIAR